MDEYIRSLINQATGGLSNAVLAVVARLASVWSVVTGFFGLVHAAEVRYRTAVQSWIAAQLRHAAAVAVTMKWIVLTYIPYRIWVAVTAIETWTATLINEAKAAALADLHAIKQWAIGEFNVIVSATNALINWATAQFSAVIGRIARIETIVFSLLSAPDRLAAWLVGAMVSALIQFGTDHAEAIGRSIWARRQTVGIAAAHWIEDLILKIM